MKRGELSFAEWARQNGRERLLEQWDASNPLGPEQISFASNQKVLWTCSECKQTWTAAISNRIASVNNCPFCTGRKVIPGVNDLLTECPDLAAEWDYEKNSLLGLEPSKLRPGSNKKVWWICSRCGNSWEAVINSRYGGRGCKKCNCRTQISIPETIIRLFLSQYIDSVEHNKKIDGQSVFELDIYLPDYRIGIEYDGVRWHKNTDRDVKKDNFCTNQNIFLIRIREDGLPDYESSSLKIPAPVQRGGFDYLIPCIKQICDVLLSRGVHIEPDYNIISELLPIAISEKTAVKENSLVNYPCAAEWNTKRNNPLTPQHLTKGSTVKVWWLCSKCGYEWRTPVSVRANMGCGCPRCAGQIVTPGQSLADVRPDLMSEWDYEANDLDPHKIMPHSNVPAWWQCSTCGYKWTTSPSHRMSGKGCPACAGQCVAAGINDLASQRPDIAAEWDYDKNNGSPDEYHFKSHKKVWWKCGKCGYEWETMVYCRTKDKMATGCPCCASQVVIHGVNDLATSYPQLCQEWDYEQNDLPPESYLPNSNKKVYWKCEKGHSWQAVIGSRTKNGNNCPICSNQKILPGYNDFATIHPELLSSWDYDKNADILPEQVASGTERKVYWKCPKGHSYFRSVGEEVRRNNRCPVCYGQKVVPGENDLETLFPDVAAEWNYERNNDKPSEYRPYSEKKKFWKCSKGHEWEAIIASRTSLHCGCPYCANQKVLAGYNDLETTYPELSKEWDYSMNGDLLPSQVVGGANRKVAWICKYGHRWKATIASRAKNGNGCPYCSNRAK